MTKCHHQNKMTWKWLKMTLREPEICFKTDVKDIFCWSSRVLRKNHHASMSSVLKRIFGPFCVNICHYLSFSLMKTLCHFLSFLIIQSHVDYFTVLLIMFQLPVSFIPEWEYWVPEYCVIFYHFSSFSSQWQSGMFL